MQIEITPSLTLLYDWYKAFSLPLWSLMVIGLWHDIGRDVWHKWLVWSDGQSNEFSMSAWVVFAGWMCVIFTYILQFYVSLESIPSLVILPLFGWVLRDWLIMNWSVLPRITTLQFIFIVSWFAFAYIITTLLNTMWIVGSVWISTIVGTYF